MKLFKIFAGIMAFFGLFFGISLFFSSAYHIERTTVVNIPLNQTFNYLNQMRNWSEWSPWNSKLDSTMHMFYSQNSVGEGATQYFRGELVGVGRFRIIESIPNQKITYNQKLSVGNSELSINRTFTFKQLGNKTQLTWTEDGDVGYNPFYRYLLPNMVSTTETGFDEGLLSIKYHAERWSMGGMSGF